MILVLLFVPLTTEAESPTPAALGVGVDEFRISAKDEAAAVDDDAQTSVWSYNSHWNTYTCDNRHSYNSWYSIFKGHVKYT